MKLNKQEFKIDFAGQPLSLTISNLAEQATAAVLGQYGDTSVLVTAVMGNKDREGIDYFPLVVDYEEKFYAAGKIIGSRFIRREGRPSEDAVLSGRLIDRTLRPLFDQKMRRDVQIIITVLSYDEENDPTFIALLSASAALAISEIPWSGPVAGLRLAKKPGSDAVINPTNSFFAENQTLFDAFIAGTENKINMIELGGSEVKEDEVIESFKQAHQEIKKIIELQKELVGKFGKPKTKVELAGPSAELVKKVQDFLKGKLEEAVYVKQKTDRVSKIEELKKNFKEHLTAEGLSEQLSDADALFEEELDKLVRKNIVEAGKRPDGRKPDEVRELYAEVGLFKRLHGSALFMRGNTQALTVTTLAAPGAEQLIETMEISGKRRFMLHYNFPPYCTGEIGRMGGPGRREIGHGALAEKALKFIIPSQEEFPYTIRVVSEILSSNGSSSMASACASSMSLMDAGVPIKKAVAGIAMGLFTEKTQNSKLKTQNYKILTDIQGPEDHYGDMDAKIAGTKDGITAIQMDVKIEGLTPEMLKEVLIQAKKARLEILEAMNKVIDKPRAQISSFAPIVSVIDIKPEQIGEVIGPGGKIINAIIADTGVTSIDIEQTGKIFVAGPDYDKVKAAISTIKGITKEFKVGDIVEGEVIKILEFGAIVDLGAGKDGMIHVSELKEGFVKKVEDVVKIGDFVRAKIIKVENGKIGLSLRAMKE